MNFPVRYPFDPPWRIVVWSFAIAVGMTALTALQWIKILPGLAIGSIFVFFGGLCLLRRLAFNRHLEINQDEIFLPTGFPQLRTVRVAYSNLLAVWEEPWALGTVLYLRTESRRYEIVCGILLESANYVLVRDFLMTVAGQATEQAQCVRD
jgi:hypothetical protein